MADEWMKVKTEYGAYTCPIHKTVLLIGDRWTLFILREFIYNGERQGFNQLLRSLKPISSRTLAAKLSKLVSEKIIQRRVLKQERPMQVEYKVLEKGRALKKALQSMGDWHKEYSC